MQYQKESMDKHPEGGHFKEIFRSPLRVSSSNGTDRSALTHIYFSLRQGELSRFHRVDSDELWNLYRGAFRLHLWDDSTHEFRSIELNGDAETYCVIVPARVWQAAEPLTEEALAGCSVAPGFEFDDFHLIDPESATAQKLLSERPEMERFVLSAGEGGPALIPGEET